MNRALRTILLLAAGVGLFPVVGRADDAADRRARMERRSRTEPGLILETGARLGACDVLTFTPDGKYLLAAGDDKVVRVWKFTPRGLELDQTLRWTIYREQRGAIYALALSPDEEGRRVAIGGYPASGGCAVAILDRSTGKVLSALHSMTHFGNTWAMAFSPSGEQVAYGTGDGSVYVWDFMAQEKLIGKHLKPGRSGFNVVRFVTFLNETTVVSVAEDGRVLQWEIAHPNQPVELFRFDRVPNLFRVALSQNRAWIAAIGQGTAEGKSAREVEIRSFPDGRQSKGPIKMPEGNFPHSLAFDANGKQLAVGVRTVSPRADFFKEIDHHILVYDLTNSPPRGSAGPKPTFRPEALAFHPDGAHFAVAGGNNHEVTLWQLPETRQPVGKVESPGSCLWAVALSKDDRYLGFKDQREIDPPTPNIRGKGPWRVFDLKDRKWARTEDFQPVQPLTEYGGWRVEPSKSDGSVWYVVGPDGRNAALPLDKDLDGFPWCWTFLKPTGGRPLRLAVGHYWGISIFEITERTDRDHPPQRVQLLTGHQGEVMALAPSADQKALVSASRDQTIAGWSLVDWPSQPQLGASFTVQGGKLLVLSVDAGSPAWEAKLTPGDEIVLFKFYQGSLLYDPHKTVPTAERSRWKILETAEECQQQLRHPVPGQEFYFKVKGPGQDEPFATLTTVRQRPLWRFFPTRDGEWVLWRWRDYYYDTSTHGDSYIGWQVNGELKDTPAFYSAEKFRDKFHKPEKIAAVLRDWVARPDRVIFPDIEPPGVAIKASATSVKDAGVTLEVAASPRGDKPAQQLDRVVLWLNEYRLESWAVKGGDFRRANIPVPREKFRLGDNTLTVQCYNQAGGRADDHVVIHFASAQAVRSNVHGLVVGINDYSASKGFPGGSFESLRFAKADAKAILEVWQDQKNTKLYKGVDLKFLTDHEATRERIVECIRSFAGVNPNDWVVIFLSGHGYAEENQPSSFMYVLADTDYPRARQTALLGEVLADEMAKLNCRKLILLDACHSGSVTELNQVRGLTRDGIPLLILAACQQKQSSMESALDGHGLFTLAILDAVGKNFARADTNGDGRLDAQELEAYVGRRVPEMVEDLRERRLADPDDQQNPVASPLRMGSVPLLEKR